MMLGLLGVVVAILLGYFITSLLWPSSVSPISAIAFSPAVGVGLCSVIFIIFRRPMFVAEGVLLLILGTAWLILRGFSWSALSSIRAWHPPAAYLLLALAVGMVLSYCMIRVERSPHGDGDAIAIWNSHARYLYRDGPSWRKTILNTFHPDYPLLTAATVARLWRYMGKEIPDAAGSLGILYTLTAAGILAGTLAELRRGRRAVLFTLILLGTPFYVEYGVSGSADVPLSLYILATIALLCLHSNAAPDKLGLLVLAGFTAGCAGWTKNEGLLFMVSTAAALLGPIFWKTRETLRRFSAFLAGIILPGIVLLWFKLTIAPPNDIMGGATIWNVVHKVLTPQRYLTISAEFGDTFWSFGNWIVSPVILVLVYVALQRFDRKMLANEGWLQGVSICITLMAGYFAIYMIGPIDIRLLIESSLPRLYLHVWPAFLMLAALLAISPEEQQPL
jgi:hypothetical protein